MSLKTTIVTFLFTLIAFFVIAGEINKKEVLIRAPFLSDKNSVIISESLGKLNGIENVEVCYDVHVVIVTFDQEVMASSIVLESLSQLEINTSFEEISERDIPIIRKNYKVISVHTPPLKKDN